MKTTKFFYALAAAACMALCLNSCDKEEEYVSPYEIEYEAPAGVVKAGTPVTFSDNSLNVASRAWTFQDATPATSTAASVDVTFNTPGTKTVTLSVTFTDNAVKQETLTVNVVDPVDGAIKVSSTTALGCIRIGSDVTFSLENVSGKPDSYSWTFEGATVATSTDAAPVVKWDKRVRQAKVTCTLKRSSDNAETVLEKTYIVGNYPMFRDLPDLGIDNYSFELERLGGWIAYTETGKTRGTSGENNIFSIAEGGANGTAHSLCVDVTKLTLDADGTFADLFPRDAWACNAHLEKDKNYELSFWMKGENFSEANTEKWVTPTIQIVNWLEDWMTVDGTDLTAGSAWTTVFPDGTFAAEGNTPLYEEWWQNGAAPDGWKNVKINFKASKDTHNTYPYFRVYTGMYDKVYFDEIEINLIEE